MYNRPSSKFASIFVLDFCVRFKNLFAFNKVYRIKQQNIRQNKEYQFTFVHVHSVRLHNSFGHLVMHYAVHWSTTVNHSKSLKCDQYQILPDLYSKAAKQ